MRAACFFSFFFVKLAHTLAHKYTYGPGWKWASMWVATTICVRSSGSKHGTRETLLCFTSLFVFPFSLLPFFLLIFFIFLFRSWSSFHTLFSRFARVIHVYALVVKRYAIHASARHILLLLTDLYFYSDEFWLWPRATFCIVLRPLATGTMACKCVFE